jgi:hypothetical protein
MIVQVQEAGQFGTMDKLGMLLWIEVSIHIDGENCEHMVECKYSTLSVFRGISHKGREQFCFWLLCSVVNLVSCPARQHMLVYDHFSNGQSGTPCYNKKQVGIENKLEAYGPNPPRTHKNRKS